MPRISAFYGIAITMYYAEHGVPHFHALYAGQDASTAIETLEILGGSLPDRRSGSFESGRCSIARSSKPIGDWRETDCRSSASRRFRKMKAMTTLVHVAAVEVIGEHRLRLRFEDGAEGELDLSAWPWRGVFEPLRDPEFFAKVKLDDELGTIVWPNGADLAPESLHEWVTHRLSPAPA
jgi:hypothetical protein